MWGNRPIGVTRDVVFFILFALIAHVVLVRLTPNLSFYLKNPTPSFLREEHLQTEGVDLQEDERLLSIVQRVREEVIKGILCEMAKKMEESHPPLPQIGLFPPDASEKDKLLILKRSRVAQDLEAMVRSEQFRGYITEAPRPPIDLVSIGEIPLPEDTDAKRIANALRESAKTDVTGSIYASAIGVKGPAAQLQLLSKPPFEGTIDSTPAAIKARLKFWVLPDGTVGKVIVQGDCHGDCCVQAIKLLRQYRFNPLSTDQPHKEVWGLISIQSVLQ